MQKVTLTAQVVILPGHEAAVLAAARTCARATHREPGCEQYLLTTQRDRPNVILFMEIFKSDADFQAHGSAPHTQTFLASLKGRVENDGPTLTFFEQVDLSAT